MRVLVHSMTVSVDGRVGDARGRIDRTTPGDHLITVQLAHVGDLGAYLLGRRLHETMRVWETDTDLVETRLCLNDVVLRRFQRVG